ncbi:MAG: hypothetical protein R3F20_06965 [Planctomycetota bacterium]
MIGPRNLLASALAAAFLVCPVFGQGFGSPLGTGDVPRPSLSHREVGVPNLLRVRPVPPSAGMLLAVANSQAPIPLASMGLGPAILGPDLASPGASLLSGLLSAGDGVFRAGFTVPLFLAGIDVEIQAAAFDPTAPFGGVAISEHLRVRFGFEAAARPFARLRPDGDFDLVEIFADATLAAPEDARLSGVAFVAPTLANTDQWAWGDRDRPGVDGFAAPAQRLRLPWGTDLLVLERNDDVDVLALVHADGRLEPVLEAPGDSGEPGFEPLMAASPYDPYVAVVSKPGLPAFNNRHVLLVRVDGRNIPGTPAKAVSVALPGNFEPDPDEMSFLDGALFIGKNNVLHRVDLGTFAVAPVVFPPVAGAAPTSLDKSWASAGDGSILAIGAGLSATVRDVFLVDAQGTAQNLTQDPAQYGAASVSQQNGGKLALDHGGTWIAYTRTTPASGDAFMRGIAPGSPEYLVTNPFQFSESIDTVVGVGFAAAGRLTLAAGFEVNQLDLFVAEPPAVPGPDAVVSNASQSGTPGAPLFGPGASLSFRSRYFTGSQLVTEFDNSAGPGKMLFVGTTGTALTIDHVVLEARAPRAAATLVATCDPAGILEVGVVPAGPTPQWSSAWISAGPANVVAQSHDEVADRATFLVNEPGGICTLVVDGTGTATTAAGPSGMPYGGLSRAVDGTIAVLTLDPATMTSAIERFDPQNPAAGWVVVGPGLAASDWGRFLN